METYRLKIKEIADAKGEIARLKAEGQKIVFTNGCFDILHSGHARYLFAARQLGDHLIVAVNSDRSVKAIKGSGRPILAQEARAELVAALECVDTVLIFDEDTPFKVIEGLRPDVLVKGGDWAEEEIVGADLVKEAGGKVARIPFVTGYSTTDIIDKIRHHEPQ
jgi:D-beta-D-heptose 7-phosphate kinase/D-beta-D-heptose 1-phosphate adenosyltransferase